MGEMSGWKWLKKDIKKETEQIAKEVAESYLRSEQFQNLVIDLIIKLPDDKPLTKAGFLGKMAGHIFTASNREIRWTECKDMAWKTWCEFSKDNKVRFGDEGWDWDGYAAKTVAYEYNINYWEG